MKLFRCTLCGHFYTKESGAAACKDTHVEPLRVNKQSQMLYVNDIQYEAAKLYPTKIIVPFEDGEVVTYLRSAKEVST